MEFRLEAGHSEPVVLVRAANLRRMTSWLLASTVLCWASAGLSSPTFAQQSPQTTAQSRAVQFSIPAQPLPAAINAFIRATGWQVGYSTRITDGHRSTAVAGAMPPAQALQTLLSGTEISVRFTGANTATLVSQNITASGAATVPGAIHLDQIDVQGAGNPNSTMTSMPAYAGGQVATGGQVGILGNRDIMSTPFNQTSYTSKLMQDQQNNFIADALSNDPSAYSSNPRGVGFDEFNIRGFRVVSNDILFNGAANVAPTYNTSAMSESIERIEVLKGPSALLNGMAPGGSVGGSINLVPKRAGDEPITQFTPSYSMKPQLGGHVDIGRRLGPDNAFGVRFNGVYRDGDTAIENQSRESRLASLALDYRGERFRLSSDLGYQYQDFQGIRGTLQFAANGAVPQAPNNRRNFSDPWEFATSEIYYGALRGEYDITDNLTAFAGVGWSQDESLRASSTRTITNVNGDLAARSISATARKNIGEAADFGVRGSFDTGPISHQMTVGYSRTTRDSFRTIGPGHAVPASNIYSPTYGTVPSSTLFPNPDEAGKFGATVLTSSVVGDTLSILDKRIQLTLGARYQEVEQTNFNSTTGASIGGYKADAVTPMVGLVVMPWHNVSFYGNYIEGLQQGPTAPTTAANAGEVFPPYVTKQYEVGMKIDFGRITTTLAAYQVAQPNGFTDPNTNIFGVDGEQRHRGVELNVFGEVSESVRLLGGVSYINAVLTETQGGTNDGNTAIGVPEYRVVAGVEWDTPFLRGLTLTGRVTHSSSAYLNAANTQKAPGWTQFDIGARYRIERAAGKPIFVRASIDNVLGSSHWTASNSGELYVSEPLTFKLSASFDF